MKSIIYYLALFLLLSTSATGVLATTAGNQLQSEANADLVIIENLQAGALEAAIRAKGLDPLEVVSLTISGSINGTDLRLLRYMGGADELGAETSEGSLTTLNLAESNIVSGGVFYIQDNTDVQYFSADNELGTYIFFHCCNLRSITLPNSIASLGAAAFSNCKRLMEVNFPIASQLTTIPKHAFYGNVNLGYDSILKIKKPLVLPSSITSIGANAFTLCRSLADLDLPNSLEIIEQAAFYGCDGLESVLMHNNVKQIEDGAFMACFNLKSAAIPTSLESIGVAAFKNCRSITGQVNIPASVNMIGEEAFLGTSAVTAFNVATDNPSYSSTSGILFDKDQTLLVNYPCAATLTDEYRVPSTVTEIGAGAFYSGSSIKKLFIPASVVEIGALWCSYNTQVEEIEFDANNPIESVGDMSFCFKLLKVTLPTALQVIEVAAFEMCPFLRECAFPAGLTKIGDMAFTWSSLERIHIPKTLIGLGFRVFFNCRFLSEVTVEEGHEYFIAENNILYNKEKSAIILYSPGITNTSFAVTPSILEIAEGAFSSNRYLKEVTIPETLSGLGMAAFFACSSMEKLTLPDNMVIVPELMCAGNASMKSVNIPKSVQRIGDGAFAFLALASASNLWIDRLFSPISSQVRDELIPILEDLLTPTGPQPTEPVAAPTLGKHIILPLSLEYIGFDAFLGAKIDTLETLNPTPLVLESDGPNKTVFQNKSVELSTLLVPTGCVAAYSEADQWEWFGTIEESKPTSVEEIEETQGRVIGSKGGFRIESLTAESAELKIYSVLGTLHQLLQVSNNDFIPASKGIYIVDLAGKAHKEIVY